MENLYLEIKKLDQKAQFNEANNIWNRLITKDKIYLEQRLKDLIHLQESYCSHKMTQCRLSMTYHYHIICILEKHRKLLDEKRYYYRTYTYILVADYLSHLDLYECAGDCYFRALIFQQNFEAFDQGYIKIKTILGIMHCYDMLNDIDMILLMKNEFTKEVQAMKEKYQKVWNILWYILNQKYILEDRIENINFAIDNDILKLLDTYNYKQVIRKYAKNHQ